MLIRRQDISVLLMYCLGYSRIRNRVFRLQRKPVTRVIVFHDIPPKAIECFKANLNFLKRNTNVVGLDDFFAGRLSSEHINVVITFDDGYKSWVSHAMPILKHLELPATFFISSGFVGLSKEDESQFMRSNLLLKLASGSLTAGLSVEDVRRLTEEGFTIGGHTSNHCNLAKLRDPVAVRHEILEDKMRLERITGRKIEYFAYPFGAYYSLEVNLPEIVREVGYRAAVTTVVGFNSLTTNPYLLHRDITDASMVGWVFRARAFGNYDAVRFLKQQLSKS